MKTLAEKKYKSLIITTVTLILLIITIFGLGWYLTFRISKEVSKVNTEATNLNKELDERISGIQKYNRVNDFVEPVKDALPSSKEVSSYIGTLEELASSHNLKITQSTFGVDGKSTKNVKDLNLSQTIKQKDYYELPIKYTIEGHYSDYLNFLSGLENLRRLNNVANISIVKDEKEPTTDIIEASFTDTIYIR